ncbi:Peptidase T [Porphyromonas crevioricanis]|uniref:Peptidase T n=2 Tax=Porphyromonas crevioricanis TaxID=393921 RepID=A0A2X4PFG5_9PORP|nr:tripeptide aminopeptidase [Porphyromonas crevioricanis JCM 13913]SQH72646.1 Peptidase T [Porphyromonas crevioricanis]
MAIEAKSMSLLERFLRYVAVDTQSNEGSTDFPSTAKQLNLLNMLAEELRDLGLQDVKMDQYGYVTAGVPASPGMENAPVIGLIAHVDTSPDMIGCEVKPQIIENYDGQDIALNPQLTMRVADFPELATLQGHTLITTDGTTLLGADDKAGVAEIMTVVELLQTQPELKHGPLRIGFTPDEEIGRGVDHFDVPAFGADFAYTIDGGYEGEIEYENFNAASAKIDIRGRNVHPGYAKGKMINALQLAIDLHSQLPEKMRPECTEGYEGFYHLHALSGSVEQAQMSYILRDHDRSAFEEKKALLTQLVEKISALHSGASIKLELEDQYYNMREKVEPYPQLIDKALEAMKHCGVSPRLKPIRGGTDGARLSFMGLPCPNLFTGGMNFHGRYEYVSFTSMQRAVDTLLHLLALWGQAEKEGRQ